MNKPIITTIILVLIGILVGFFILVSYQFHSNLNRTEALVLQNADRLSGIEAFLTDNFINKQ
ncbi:MAG: hypothetical protein V1865_00740 [bacterium]